MSDLGALEQEDIPHAERRLDGQSIREDRNEPEGAMRADGRG